MSAHERTPLAASTLGYLGLVPFVALAALVFVAPDSMRNDASFALLAYGATILSFLGGVHWGLAIASPTPHPRAAKLGMSVVPQLLGWSALLAPAPYGHALTATGLLAVLVIDAIAVKSALVPAWFMQLRWPLSCAAALSLCVAAFHV
ncbi:MAG: DUF3429 domain-containing protein [Hyphomonadaceae bacterium]|nr:DUF3429 domain-containing protein [Hyphomonadaceae bacterium]